MQSKMNKNQHKKRRFAAFFNRIFLFVPLKNLDIFLCHAMSSTAKPFISLRKLSMSWKATPFSFSLLGFLLLNVIYFKIFSWVPLKFLSLILLRTLLHYLNQACLLEKQHLFLLIGFLLLYFILQDFFMCFSIISASMYSIEKSFA